MSIVSYDRNLFRAIRLSLIQGSFHRELLKKTNHPGGFKRPQIFMLL